MKVEIETNLAFSNMRRGQRIMIDNLDEDPVAQGWLRAGYAKVVWWEQGDAVEDGPNPDGVAAVPDSGVDEGMARPAAVKRKKTGYGTGGFEHDSEGGDSAQADPSLRSPDSGTDPQRG